MATFSTPAKRSGAGRDRGGGDVGFPYLVITLLAPSCSKGLDFYQPALISIANHNVEALITAQLRELDR